MARAGTTELVIGIILYQTRLRRRRQSDPLIFNHALAQPQGTPKWLPAENVGDVSGRDPTKPSQAAGGDVLWHSAGAQEAIGESAAGGGAPEPGAQRRHLPSVHLMRNILAYVPKVDKAIVAAVLMEIVGECQVTRRYFPSMSATCACLSRRSGQGATGAGRTGSHESMKKLLDPEPLLVPEPASFWLAPVN